MSKYPFFVEVSIIEQIYPDERDRRYGDPLSRLLNQSLPLHIYENVDTETFLEGLRTAFSEGNVGEVRGPRAWESEVLIYFAGKDVDEMFTRIQQLPNTFPILQNARIVFQRRSAMNAPPLQRLPFND